MKRFILSLAMIGVIIAGAVLPASGQPVFQQRRSKLSDVDFYTTNYGIFGLDIVKGSAGFIVPRGSGLSYIFGSGLWFGARKRVGTDMNKLTFITYEPSSGGSWAVPNGSDPLYNSVDYDPLTGQPSAANITAPWPLWLRADQTARPADPGYFENVWGERHTGAAYRAPAFVPGVAEQIVSRFNDRDLTRYVGVPAAAALGYPLGLDIEQSIYAWRGGPLKDFVILKYAITNTSADTLYNCVASQMADFDLGNPANDHCSYFARRPELRTGYAWTDAESANFRTLAMSIIEAPVLDANGYIDLHARAGYQQGGRVGSFQSWQLEEQPVTPLQRYDFISDATQHDADLGPGDKRALIASEKFTMRPGDVAHFAVLFAVVGGRPSETPGSSPSELETLIEAVNADYYSGQISSSAPQEPAVAGSAGIALIPNPARDAATVRFNAAAAGPATLRVSNSLGQSVIERDLGYAGRGMLEIPIDVSGLADGLYFVSVTAGSASSTATLTVVR